MRRALGLAAALLAGACARGAPARVPDPSAPPRSAFELRPAAEVAAARNPHAHGGKPLCQRCHLPDLALVGEPNALCRACHSVGHNSHPVDVVQRTPADALPLLEGGKLACHSCHDPHRAKPAIRKPFNELCVSCHRRH